MFAVSRLQLIFYSSIILIIYNASAEKPNIIIIMADDMGWNDLGYRGSEIPTPNIDALAYSGIILNRHYSLPCCSPSRSSFLTGRDVSSIGMQGRPLPSAVPLGVNLKLKLMPQFFKHIGYYTNLVGKWHVGYFAPEYLPTNRGFDTFFGYLNGFLDYYDGSYLSGNITGLDCWRNTKKAWQEFYGKYLTTLLTEEAVNVIKNHSENGKQDGLFLMVSSVAPHLGNRDFRLEPPPFTHGQRTRNITDPNRRLYADVMKGLDDQVGAIVAALKEYKLIENSIIVFFSDNGAPTIDKMWGYTNYGSNWPLKGEKMSVNEGGVRTGAILWSPLIMESQRSRIYNGLFHISDWLPTLYRAAGGNLDDLAGLDGVNQWDNLCSNNSENIREHMLIDMEDQANIEAIIADNMKMVKNYDKSNDFSHTDDYYGSNSRGILEYNKTEVINSQVALSLPGKPLDEVTIERLKKGATIINNCNSKQKEQSVLNDCHTKYCLYDIISDPSECNDLAKVNPKIVDKLTKILDYYRSKLVKREDNSFDKRGFPGESNYWEPWLVADGSSSTTNLISSCLLIIFVMLL